MLFKLCKFLVEERSERIWIQMLLLIESQASLQLEVKFLKLLENEKYNSNHIIIQMSLTIWNWKYEENVLDSTGTRC